MGKAGVVRHSLALACLVILMTACGNGDSSTGTVPWIPATSIATTTSTTFYTQHPCFKFPVAVLSLQNDWRLAQRGVVIPDKEPYRRRAQALVDEAQALGCPPLVGLSSFLRP